MNLKSNRLLACTLCAFLLVWTASAMAQEQEQGPSPAPTPEGPTPVETDEPEHPPISPRDAQSDLQEEMRAIFRRVETKLKEIDVLLSDAGAGDPRRLAEAEAAGIDDLLRQSVAEGRDVQREIEELLKIAQQANQSQSSSSPSPSSSQGQGQSGSEQQGPPNQGQGSNQRRQEATPSLPEQVRPEDGGDQPKPGEQGEQPSEEGGEKPGDQPKPGEGEQPEDGPERADDDPENRASNDPKPDETDAPSSNGDRSERWGELPVHVRDAFRTEGGEDLPPEYRDWIDAYYKKLNERTSRSR